MLKLTTAALLILVVAALSVLSIDVIYYNNQTIINFTPGIEVENASIIVTDADDFMYEIDYKIINDSIIASILPDFPIKNVSAVAASANTQSYYGLSRILNRSISLQIESLNTSLDQGFINSGEFNGTDNTTFEIFDILTLNRTGSSRTVLTEFKLPREFMNQVFSRRIEPDSTGLVPRIKMFNLSDAVRSIEFDNVVLNGSLDLLIEDIVLPNFTQSYAIDAADVVFELGSIDIRAIGSELYECSEWDFNSTDCTGDWVLIRENLVPGSVYTLPIESNTAYAERLEILNIQSYPEVGGNWTVKFNTGAADLQIRAINGTTWRQDRLEGHDLRFLNLLCNDEVVEYEWINNTVFVRNYQCNETGYEISNVQTAGIHTLEFRFGRQIAYAKNLADALRMEWGNVTGVDDTWVQVDLINEYNDPVVVATPHYTTAGVPSVTRVTNVTSTSFMLKLQRPGDATAPTTRDVFYLVAEVGQWQLPDGRDIEAGRYTCTVTNRKFSWAPEAVSYQHSYTNPVVLGQVITDNDPDWSAFWASDGTQTGPPTSADLEMCKHVGEDTDQTRTDEVLGYIVIEEGHGTLNGVEYDAVLTGDTVESPTESPPYTESYSSNFATVPEVAVASAAAIDGGDGGWPVVYGAFATNLIGLAFDEDDIGDSERGHTDEQVAVFTFATPGSFVDNSPPEITNPQFNTSIVELGYPVMFNVTVIDRQGNFSVASVNATFQYPNQTRINISLYQTIRPLTSTVSDQESGEIEYLAESHQCEPSCPTNVIAENNVITIAAVENSRSVDLKNEYVLNKTFIKVHHGSGHTSTAYPDESSVSAHFTDNSTLLLERYNNRAHIGYLSYSIIQADNIFVRNFSYSWSASEEVANIAISPTLPTDYNDRCFVETHRNFRLNSASTSNFVDVEVRTNLTSTSNLRLTRDAEGAGSVAAGVQYGFIVCFLDDTYVQTGEWAIAGDVGSEAIVPIGTIDRSESISIINWHQDDNGVGTNSLMANLTSTDLIIHRDEVDQGSSAYGTFYVVDFENNSNADVQHIYYQANGTGTLLEYTTPSFNAVDHNQTLLNCENTMANGGGVAFARGYWGFNLTEAGDQIYMVEGRDRGNTQYSDVMCQVAVWPNMTSIETDLGTNDTNADTNWVTYTDVDATDSDLVASIKITIDISAYSNAGSSSRGNTDPDINVELATADEDGWTNIGRFGIDSTGTYSMETTNNEILAAWAYPANRDVRLRARYMDYVGPSTYDYINYTSVYVNVSYGEATSLWTYEWTDTVNAGYYNVTDIYADDTLEINHSQFNAYFLATDTTPPTITYIANITIQNQTPLGVDFDATDYSGIDTWWLNDSRFSINSSGFLKNATALNVYEYWLNVSVNDTFGNTAWQAIFVNVTLEPDTSPPWFDPDLVDQFAEYNVTFTYDTDAYDETGQLDIYWVNDTIRFIMDPETGLLQNLTLLPIGAYSINISVNDSAGNVNWSVITVTVQDTRPPIFNPPVPNMTTEAYTYFSYDVNASDYSGVHRYWINDTANFRINAITGLLENNTGLGLGIYSLNISVNDTFGNMNYTVVQFTVTDTTPPDPVSGLGETSAGYTWIEWSWTNPLNPDFDHVEIWINNTFYANTSLNSYNATGLLPSTVYEIQTRTADTFANVNQNWVNDSAQTISNDAPYMLVSTPENQSVHDINFFDIVLNITAVDNDLDLMCVDIYGSDNPVPSDLELFYTDCNIANNTNIIYNWTSPVRTDDSDIGCLYHFDSRSEYGETSTTVNDFGGSCNDATCSGGTCPAFRQSRGKFAGAFFFDSGDYFDMGATPLFDAAWTDRSMELWYHAKSISDVNFRTIWEEGGGTNGMNIYIYDSRVFAGYWLGGSGQWLNFTTTAGDWHYLAIIFDGNNNFTLVHDDQYQSISISDVMASHGAENYLGDAGSTVYHTAGVELGFHGYIDEFVVYEEYELPLSTAFSNYKIGVGGYNWYVNITDSIYDVMDSMWDFYITGAYHTFYGNATGQRMLGMGSSIMKAYDTGGAVKNIYLTDTDTVFDYNDLQAVGRQKDGSAASNDFIELDSILDMVGDSDAPSLIWAIDGSTPKRTETFDVHGNIIANVPIVTSTRHDSFRTGILWDTADSADDEMDSVEDENIVFITKYNDTKAGEFGTYGFEAYVPENVSTQVAPTNTISFFVEME